MAFNKRIHKAVQEIFPKKTVTPIDFRRSVTTAVFKSGLTFQTHVQDLVASYATLINTSDRVSISMKI